MSRKQIGLRMKDETRDQLEKVRGSLSRTDYIEGAVLAQIARDLKDPDLPSLEDYRNAPSGIGPLAYEWEDKPHRLVYDLIKRLGWSPPGGEFPNTKEPNVSIIEDERMPPNMVVSVPGGEVFVGGDKIDSEIIGDHTVLAEKNKPAYDWPVRSSAESKANVLPVPKKTVKGRK